MLSLISWNVFTEVLFVSLGIYYMAVAVLYYKAELGALLRGKRPFPASIAMNPIPDTPPGSPGKKEIEEPAPAEFALTERIVVELKGTIKKVMADEVEKEDLLRSIAHVLRQCPELKNTAYGKAINNFIIRECGSSYAVHLDEDEVIRLWS
jgi:hypothetical protein